MRDDALETRIIEKLKRGQTIEQLSKSLNWPSSLVRNALQHLQTDGHVQVAEHGVWTLKSDATK